MEKWTLMEAQSQYCTRGVVGRPKDYWPPDTLETTWTAQDAEAGRCLAEEVGMSRFPPRVALAPPEGWEPPRVEELDDTSSEAPTTDWIKSAFQGMGGRQAFVAYCKANPAQMWPLLLKGGLTQFLKEDVKPKSAYELSDEEIQNLSTLELKKLLLAAKDICPHCKGSLKSA